MRDICKDVEQSKVVIDACKGYAEIGLCCQKMIDLLLEQGRFEGNYSDMARAINLIPTNVRKYILRSLDWGIFDVEFRATGDMNLMTAISLSEDWLCNLAALGKKGEHRAWHTK